MQGLWADDLQVAVIEPTSSYVPDEDDAKLKERLHGHTLGNILTTSTMTIPVPHVQPHFETDDRRMKAELDDHACDANLVLHSRILQNLRNSSNQCQTPIAAQVLSQSCPNSGRAMQMWPTFGNRIKDPLFLHGLRCQLGIPLVLPVPDDIACHCGTIVREADLTSPLAIDENGHA